MKILLTLFVLLFSSTVFSETFKCQLEYKKISGEDVSFELFIDTGDTDTGFAVLLDKKNEEIKQIITNIQSVGKVYSDNYPYNTKIEEDAYFSMNNNMFVRGFFINVQRAVPIDIDLKNINPDEILISIYDPTIILFDGRNNIEGVCK